MFKENLLLIPLMFVLIFFKLVVQLIQKKVARNKLTNKIV